MSAKLPALDARSRGKAGPILAAGIIVILVGGIVWAWSAGWFQAGLEDQKVADRKGDGRPDDNDGGGDDPAPGLDTPGSQLTAETQSRLVELRNQGLAVLENDVKMQIFAPAAAAFTEIVAKLPDEPLGLVNLALTRYQMLKGAKGSPSEVSQALELAREAASQLRAKLPNSPVGYVISARLSSQAGGKLLMDRATAERETMEFLRKAVELAPNDPALWWDLHFEQWITQQRISRQPTMNSEATASLERAVELAPTNLYLLKVLMGNYKDEKNPKIVGVLEQLLHTLAQMPGVVKRAQDRSKGEIPDLKAYILETIEAAKSNKWADDDKHVFRIGNIIKSETFVQGDMRRVDKNILEYVVADFSDAALRNRPVTEAPAAIPVTLDKLDKLVLPEHSHGLDVALADFDLDKRLDVILLHANGLEVFTQSSDGTFVLAVRHELAPGYTRLAVADLDEDAPRTRPDAAPAHSPPPGTAAPASAPPAPAPQPAEPTTPTPPAHDGGTKSSQGTCYDIDVDLVVYGPAGVLLLRNDLAPDSDQRSLTPIAQDESFQSLRDVSAVSLADIYHDGDLDLVVAVPTGLSLWSNQGSFSFSERKSGTLAFVPLGVPEGAPTAAASLILQVDWDRDVDLDLLTVFSNEQPLGMAENLRHGTFRFHPLFDKAEVRHSYRDGVLLDAGNDGAWDIALAGDDGLSLTSSQWNIGGGLPVVKPPLALAADVLTGVLTWDYDNDGYADLLAWSPDKLLCLHGTGAGGFAEAPNVLTHVPKAVTACRVGDLDRDGDLDAVVLDGGHVTCLVNSGGNVNGWIDVALRTDDWEGFQKLQFRVNSHGIGSVIELRAGDHYGPDHKFCHTALDST